MSNKVLSICIPTYNRGQKLIGNLKKWLANDNNKFEIVISDNCSTDNTVELLKSLGDERVVIIENDRNYGTHLNGIKVLQAGSGKYIMPLMDKDSISMEHIDEITDFLEKNDFAVGRFNDSCTNDKISFYKYPNKVNALRFFCFRGNHPSGFLLNRQLFHDKNVVDICTSQDEVINPFLTDFYATILCDYGYAVSIDIPFLYLVKPPFDGVKSSYTYSQKKGNLFFHPEYKFKVFEVYMNFLNNIHLSYFQRLTLLKRIVPDLYNYSTQGYIDILNNKPICDWYALDDEFIQNEKGKDFGNTFLKQLSQSDKFNSKFEQMLVKLSLQYRLNKLKFGKLIRRSK